ncbi:hypothetical protein [Actinomadura rudentiformis]|uniref:Lipoprotein n=1 Tax=Actinomadura rudentiformis TaxID=359158 RepID=A0A6H9YHC5_9ACTN|nr:hypothetical protein [Actinomadura rudentiformis]KAB2344451.1 hypothetical protein F8566_31480 [Actinomadura rudentiformis]
MDRVVAAVALSGTLVLAGCGLGDEESPSASPPSTSPPSTSQSKPATSAQAADGTDLSACADGRCEVRVGASGRIPVPRKLGVDSVQVEAVGSDAITIVGRYIGGRQSGYCTGVKCSSVGKGTRFELTLAPDSLSSQNGLSITAVAIDGGMAVLRFAPANR